MPRAQPLEKSIEILKTAQAEARSRIQTGKITARVQDIMLGDIKGDAALLGVQLRAADILLKKVLPDEQRIEQDIKVEATVNIIVEQIR